jgi:hypothetical protein
VRQRAGNRCEYCQVSQGHDLVPFEMDHITARKHRDPTRAGNLCLACFACNKHNGPNIAGVDPRTKKIEPLFNPRRHSWHRHFRWDGTVLIGLTPIGRTTIVVLEINLDYRVAFRQLHVEEGAFPPA